MSDIRIVNNRKISMPFHPEQIAARIGANNQV
jgi:hypothetical protein